MKSYTWNRPLMKIVITYIWKLTLETHLSVSKNNYNLKVTLETYVIITKKVILKRIVKTF